MGVVGLLLISSVLALARVADPTARHLIELVTLSPLGLPCAVLALLGAVTVPAARRTRAAFVLAATCLVGAHAWWLAPLYVGPHPAAGSSASLVVLAQNFEYGDASALVDVARSTGADVLVLTDVGTEQIDLAFEAGVDAGLPYSAGVDNHVMDGTAVVFSRFPITRTAPLYDDAESRVVRIRTPGLGPVTVIAVHTRPPYCPDIGGRTTTRSTQP